MTKPEQEQPEKNLNDLDQTQPLARRINNVLENATYGSLVLALTVGYTLTATGQNEYLSSGGFKLAVGSLVLLLGTEFLKKYKILR